jgi:lipopolysaccharide transport system ATP-binding protein
MALEVSPPLPAIRVRNVAKRYDLYARNLDRLRSIATGRSHAKPFWALCDATFDVYPGEAVGIVGRNGSGKSTLLQIIAGTLTPSAGTVEIRGRIAALLELGSGFNPQFTGRENCFLAGAILGISRREMDHRLADIAQFADIGDFFDQPVELYSSGMHARLAFSVAISVHPDILIVDEVLAVGDAGFQARCTARLRQLLSRGVTLLFVSHSADAVKSICSKAVFLEAGKQLAFGSSGPVVDQYLSSLRQATTARALANVSVHRPELAESLPADRSAAPEDLELANGTGHAEIVDNAVRVLDADGRHAEAFAFEELIVIEFDIRATASLTKLDAELVVRDRTGLDIFGAYAWDEGLRMPPMSPGEVVRVQFRFQHRLAPGPYSVVVAAVRRPEKPGEGLLTLHYLDTPVGGAFIALERPRRDVRGKVHLPVSVQFVSRP